MRRLHNWVLVWMSRLFHKFGIHCATHQIRLILISGLVITSLFYPAIGIYSDSISSSFNYPRSSSFNNIFGYNPHTLVFSEKDLDDIWTAHSALRVLDDDVTRARCGNEGTIRMERILLTTNGFSEDTGVITHETLATALRFETALTNALSFEGSKCLRTASGTCVRLSPLAFWSHDEKKLLNDRDPIRTVNENEKVSLFGLSIRPSMVFAGREAADPSVPRIDFASYLALTYFFHENDCNTLDGHRSWRQALESVASDYGVLTAHAHEPTLVALEFNPDMKQQYPISSMTVTLYFCYLIFFVYFSGSMRGMNSVHSRIGLCFTGLVEIIVSTITSLSVCALYGLRMTLVPWGIFPIVIVFVGAENMFRLVSDVSKTSISLPVKERIGIGLGKAGTSNTLKVVSYNTILGIIAAFSQGAIQQFCAFAIVVLVAHWFLIHTFFVAVLSIDIQRLELDDLIRQDASGAVPMNTLAEAKPAEETRGGLLKRMLASISKATKGRIKRNFSLLLLLVITGALYYSTLPPRKNVPTVAATRASVVKNKTDLARQNEDAGARDIWRLFNPSAKDLVHVRSESPAILALDLVQHNETFEKRSVRTRWRGLRALLWVVKFMVIPIGGTIGTLYALLLHLLKGTERLEVHHTSLEEKESDINPMMKKPPLKVFPRAFATDVALLSSSADGSVIASASSEGECFVWRLATQVQLKIDTSDIMPQGPSGSSLRTTPSCICLNGRGTYCAVGTAIGIIGVWAITGNSAHFIAQYQLDDCKDAVMQLEFCDIAHSTAQSNHNNTHDDLVRAAPLLVSTFSGGRIASYVFGTAVEQKPFTAGEVNKALVIHDSPTGHPLACFCMDDGVLEISAICRDFCADLRIVLQAGTPNDRIKNVSACQVVVADVPRLFVASASESGIVTVWDGAMETIVAAVEDGLGPTNHLHLLPSTMKACHQCGEVPLCELELIFSVGRLVSVERIILVQRCTCPVTIRTGAKASIMQGSPKGPRSRSGSFVSSGQERNGRPRSRHVSMSSDPVSDIPAFPVSGHGRHSKRASERDGTRRMSDFTDTFHFPSASTSDERSDDQAWRFVPESVSSLKPTPERPTSNTPRTFRSSRLLELTCERGGWGIVNGKLIVVRRKHRCQDSCPVANSRIRTPEANSFGLSSATLDRWEICVVDFTKPDGSLSSSSFALLPSASLCSIRQVSATPGFNSSRPIPRLPFTRLTPLSFTNFVCVAGFGNTIGMIDFGSP